MLLRCSLELLFRKWVYIAETARAQEFTKNNKFWYDYFTLNAMKFMYKTWMFKACLFLFFLFYFFVENDIHCPNSARTEGG